MLVTQIHELILGSYFMSLFAGFAQLLWKNLYALKGHAIFTDCKVHAENS